MKQQIQTLINAALTELSEHEVIPESVRQQVTQDGLQVDRTKDPSHGDFACNIALVMAKKVGAKPRDLAQSILNALPVSGQIAKVDIAGPGFINFFVEKNAWLELVDQIRSQGSLYGRSDMGSGLKVMVEFVSANPTGPLHVGHGRGAAYGDALARVLSAAGYDTHKEYYVNDAGRQMDILALSIWLRYLSQRGEDVQFPKNGYQGDYVFDIATNMANTYGGDFVRDCKDMFQSLEEDQDQAIDQLVTRCKDSLGPDRFKQLFDFGCDALVDDIRTDLAEFGVEYQSWFSERSLVTSGAMGKSDCRT